MFLKEAYLFNQDNYSKIEKELGLVYKISARQHCLEDIFVLIFRDYFATKFPAYRISESLVGATRSNSTIHTAYCIRSTSELLGLNCKFESLGRLDGVIETIDDKPETLLFCEWEWDVKDVFGEGKEIEKIYNSLIKSKEGKGLLISYCNEKDYASTIKKVAEYWQKITKNEDEMCLYLLLINYKLNDSSMIFDCVSTAKIYSNTIELWEDLLF